MANSPEYDVAVGMHQSAINPMVKEIYDAIHSTLLKGKIDVNKMGISSVEYDFQTSPVLSLEQSSDAIEKIKSSLESAKVKIPSSNMTEMLAVASSATFSVEVSKVALTAYYSNKAKATSITASLKASATITVEDSGYLTPEILSAAVDVSGNPVMTLLLNNALIPDMINYLEKNVFKPIKIPPLAFKSFRVSIPLPAVQNSYLTAFSALGKTSPKIPAPISWPTDGIYVAANIAVMEAAAKLEFPLGPQQTDFSWEIFSGHVGATINVPKVLNINSDGSLHASIDANVSCQLSMDTGIPFVGKISFGPSATAGLDVTIRVYVENGDVKLLPESIPVPSFSFDWGIPLFINWFFLPFEIPLALALNSILGPMIVDTLDIPSVTVYHIPDINIPLTKTLNVKLAINDVTPKGLNSEMLVVDGKVTVSS